MFTPVGEVSEQVWEWHCSEVRGAFEFGYRLGSEAVEEYEEDLDEESLMSNNLWRALERHGFDPEEELRIIEAIDEAESVIEGCDSE